MPRRTATIRVFQGWGGEGDDVASTLADNQASRFENLYRWRNVLRRRKGFSPLAASLGATNLRMLDWARIDGTDHLISVHGGDVRDWLHATPGTIVGNGTDRLPESGDEDANSAWIEDMLVIGNGTDANIRYNGASAGLAADFAVSTADGLQVAGASNALFVGQDLTGMAWVKFDDLAFNATAISTGGRLTVLAIDHKSSAAGKSWRLVVNPNTNRLNLSVHDNAGTETTVADTTVLTTGVWYCVTFRHSAADDEISIQVNGGTITTAACAHGLDEPTGGAFTVGRTYNGASLSDSMDGQIGPVGIWRSDEGDGGALTDALMTALHNNGLPLLEADLPSAYDDELVGYWDMTEASGTRDNDASAATTFDLVAVGAGAGSAEGPHAAYAVAQLMTSTPTASSGMTAVNSTGGGSAIPAGTYRYKVSFLNADGIPSPTGSSYLEVTHALTHETSVQTIPVCPAGEDCTGRRLWRLDPGATLYAFLADISNNTDTIYVDNTPSVVGNETLVEENEATPPLQVFCEHNSRLVGANGADGTLCITNKFEPYYCPSAPDIEDVLQGTRTTLQGRAAGAITGVGSHGAYCAVFTAAAGYFLTGDAPLDFAINKFANHGCTAHRTIKSARNWLIWLGPDGVYAWVDGTAQNISGDRQDTIDAMTAAEMARAHAFVWEDKYFLCWATGCMVFDLVHRIWTTNTNWLWRDCAVAEFTGSAREKLYGALEGAAHVFQIETGATDNGTTIPAVWASKDWDMGLAGRRKRAHYIEARTKKGVGTLIAALKVGSGKTVQTETHDISTVEDADETVSRLFESCREEALSEFFRLEVSCATTAAEFELQAVGLHWMPAQ